MAYSKQVSAALAALLLLVLMIGKGEARPKPDSAGIVPMINGLAYGGIPYGSVSGNLAATSGGTQVHYAQNSLLLPTASIIVPDTRSIVATHQVLSSSPFGY